MAEGDVFPRRRGTVGPFLVYPPKATFEVLGYVNDGKSLGGFCLIIFTSFSGCEHCRLDGEPIAEWAHQ